jgi:hypothetical protein
MLNHSRLLLAGIAMAALSLTPFARADRIAPPTPKQFAAQAELTIIGKVIEIEKEVVEHSLGKDAGKIAYKIAIIKIEESLVGATGLTQVRVGFIEAPPPVAGAPVGRQFPRVHSSLTLGQEACFFLTSVPGADFYTMPNFSTPLNKKEGDYEKTMAEVKKIAKTIEDPVGALKAKNVNERFEAAQLILQRYNQLRVVKPVETSVREPIPAEESKLIVDLLIELPWLPKSDTPRMGSDPALPSRSGLWYLIYPHTLGYKQPAFTNALPETRNKIMDESTLKFLQDNKDKIKLTKVANNK